MNEEILKAADATIQYLGRCPQLSFHVNRAIVSSSISDKSVSIALNLLILEDIVYKEEDFTCRLTPKGKVMNLNGQTFSDYWKEQEVDKALAKQKDLMQIRFWNFTITKDKLTLLLAGGGFLLGIFNLIKSLLFD